MRMIVLMALIVLSATLAQAGLLGDIGNFVDGIKSGAGQVINGTANAVGGAINWTVKTAQDTWNGITDFTHPQVEVCVADVCVGVDLKEKSVTFPVSPYATHVTVTANDNLNGVEKVAVSEKGGLSIKINKATVGVTGEQDLVVYNYETGSLEPLQTDVNAGITTGKKKDATTKGLRVECTDTTNPETCEVSLCIEKKTEQTHAGDHPDGKEMNRKEGSASAGGCLVIIPRTK